MENLQRSEDLAASVATHPRVTLPDIIANVAEEIYFSPGDVIQHTVESIRDQLKLMTICILVLRNGWTVVGKSAPAHGGNYNPDVGKKLAREDAMRQIWPLMGYQLRSNLHLEEQGIRQGSLHPQP